MCNNFLHNHFIFAAGFYFVMAKKKNEELTLKYENVSRLQKPRK